MICSKCQAEVREGSNFCPRCGARVSPQGRFNLVSVEVAPSCEPGEPRKVVTEVYKLSGPPMVTWTTMQDDRVCEICRLRHGKRYRIDCVPEREPSCRCTLVPDPKDS
jgi:hypothetical protein